jgi:hypothetical protein
MKKLMFIVLAIAIVFGASQKASAQKMKKKWSLGFGLEGGLPMGDMKDTYSFAGGITLRFSYHIGPGFATLTSGSLGWFPKSLDGGKDLKAGVQIPIKAGYKYIYKDHFYAMAELGYNSFKFYGIDANGDLTSYNNSGFVFAPGIGVQFNSVELGIRYEHFSLTGGSASFLGLRLGFNF